jgi:hypothetical protein
MAYILNPIKNRDTLPKAKAATKRADFEERMKYIIINMPVARARSDLQGTVFHVKGIT